MNIEQLVERGKTGDKIAINKLIEKFTPLILKLVSSIYIKGHDREDLIQIGHLSVIKAVKMFDFNSGSSFVSYVYNAIKKNYFNEIRKVAKNNYETSYEKIIEQGSYSNLFKEEGSIEDYIIKIEELSNLKDAFDKLTKKEKELIRFSYGIDHGGLKKYSNLYKIKYITAHKRKNAVVLKLRRIYKDKNKF